MQHKPKGKTAPENKPRIPSLFFRFLKVGLIGFGGGSALIPVVERELVGENRGMDPETYTKHTIIANITPGALPVKLGATCGYELGGIGGSLISAYAVALPGVLLTTLLLLLISLLGDGGFRVIRHASVGITVFILCILWVFIEKTLKNGDRKINCLLCAAAFFLTGGKEIRSLFGILLPQETALSLPLVDISTISLMILTFSLILIRQLAVGRKRESGEKTVRIAVPPETFRLFGLYLLIALLSIAVGFCAGGPDPGGFGANVIFSTVTSFGGGEAYLSVADGIFVQSGYLPSGLFYTSLVPIANALPGPILVKIASGIGFLAGKSLGILPAWAMALVGMCCSIGVCSAIAVLVNSIYDSISRSDFVKSLKRYILPVICGMLISTMCSMLVEAVRIMEVKSPSPALSFGILLAGVLLLNRLSRNLKLPDLVFLAAAAVSSLAILGL